MSAIILNFGLKCITRLVQGTTTFQFKDRHLGAIEEGPLLGKTIDPLQGGGHLFGVQDNPTIVAVVLTSIGSVPAIGPVLAIQHHAHGIAVANNFHTALVSERFRGTATYWRNGGKPFFVGTHADNSLGLDEQLFAFVIGSARRKFLNRGVNS